jgi:Rrf2 family iron-responsive transcriptional regulator
MRLTRQSSYAIRTLIYCAVNGERLSRIADIAKAHAISELFLFKLIRPLVDAGQLETVRGRRGGIRLARPASDISLLDAVKLTEENSPWQSASRAAATSIAPSPGPVT